LFLWALSIFATFHSEQLQFSQLLKKQYPHIYFSQSTFTNFHNSDYLACTSQNLYMRQVASLRDATR